MPKIVDHDSRRRELAQAAIRVIARHGFEGATMQTLGRESGWSTGVLKHYFVDKDDILSHALRELQRVNAERLSLADGEVTGYAALRSAIGAILDNEPDHSKVWIAFIARAMTDKKTASEMRRGTRAWIRRWADLVRRGQRDGSIQADRDPEQVAAALHALVSGLRIDALFRTTHGDVGDTLALLDVEAPAFDRNE